MKYKLQKRLLASLLMLLCTTSAAWADGAKKAYAISDNDLYGKGIYTFDLKSDTVDNIQLLQEMTFDRVCGSTLVDDVFYYIDYTQVSSGYQVNGFYAYDLEEKSLKQIADYGGANQGTIASHLVYDYQSKTMYGLNNLQSGHGLSKIDLETGVISSVCDFTMDGCPEKAKQYDAVWITDIISIACNYDGEMYGVSYWGGLYKINQATGACSYIGELDYNPDQAYMYNNNCLFFDNETGDLYFRVFTYYGQKYEMLKIDLKTAHVTHISKLPYDTEGYTVKAPAFDGITIPFTVAEASAPAKPQNLTVTPGAEGALTATLTWTNPDKTYGRGGTLEELSEIIILRDGEEVHRISNPTIGGNETWTDQVPERGYYTYRLVPVNSAGNGDRVSAGTYVGVANPKTVTDITLKPEGANALLSWTAPTNGLLDGYINTADLKYDIMRLPDSVKVATDYIGTSFTDKTITEMGKYKYDIVAKAGGYSSDIATSEEVVLGPDITIPDTLLASKANFELWTTIDADGNYYTWQWQEPSNWSFGGAYIYYPYDQWAPLDWLISPRIHFDANKHYKMTFDVMGAKNVLGEIGVGFGTDQTIATQDSVTTLTVEDANQKTLRVNLPTLTEEATRHISLRYTTQYVNYSIYVKNLIISEDHEGYIEGHVTCGGEPVANATVICNAGEFTATTDSTGYYKLYYLPAGEQALQVEALGYAMQNVTTTVNELETTTCDVTLTALPTYTLKGKVADVAGDPVAGASVEISGYNTYSTETAADGTFTIGDVFKSDNYYINVTKNKLLGHSESFQLTADKDFGTITLEDNIKPAQRVVATVDSTSMTSLVEWDAPANDVREDRIDDGVMTTHVGIANPTTNATFGVIRREAATVHGVKFYLASAASLTHYSVYLRIFGLKESGAPDANQLLFEKSYVPVTDDQWTEYTLPAPVDCPNGYYIAISGSSYMNIGIDGGGDSEKYPFQTGTNCFTDDYTTNNFYVLEQQSSESLHHNFLMRPISAPWEVAEDSTAAARQFTFEANKQWTSGKAPVELTHETLAEPVKTDTPEMRKTVQSRVRYNVYRLKTADMGNHAAYTLLGENQSSRSLTDEKWNSLEQGAYYYAVETVYTGDKKSEMAYSDSIGNKTYTNVKIHLNTNTTENEAYGANVTLITGGGQHVYQGTADNNGDVNFSGVWKTGYDLTVTLDGFETVSEQINVGSDDNYSFSYELKEIQVKPYNLMIDEGATGTDRLFIWNYPDAFYEGFEGHEDFTINSPGSIGWQYVDGDGAGTGGFTDYTWENAFQPMAYIVFNASQAYNSDSTSTLYTDISALRARTGDKCLQTWAAYEVPNDDWIITPKLRFNEDFKFEFYARCFQYSYPEELEILYSLKGSDTDDFILLDSFTVSSYYSYMKYSYDIPKEANYVALRCVSNQMRILSIDDISFGLASAVGTPSARPMRKAPSLEGAYDVYLDGEKVASTDETEFTFTNLTVGKHTAGVIASYTSGNTAMSTIDFEVSEADGIKTVSGGLNIALNDRTLSITGDYDSVMLTATDGSFQPISRVGEGKYSLSQVPAGVYVVTVREGTATRTMKVRLK